MRGPWKVVEIPVEGMDRSSLAVERWAVVRAWEDPQVDPPAGTFRFREIALIYAAALAVASRGAVLSVRDARDDEEGGGSPGAAPRGRLRPRRRAARSAADGAGVAAPRPSP